MVTNYALADGDGHQITAGLPAETARRTAQRLANELDTPLWLYPVPCPARCDDGCAACKGEKFSPDSAADPAGWNAYRLTGDCDTEFLGSAPSEDEACELAKRLGGTQVQHGLDGQVRCL
jgi:hypothetical protein